MMHMLMPPTYQTSFCTNSNPFKLYFGFDEAGHDEQWCKNKCIQVLQNNLKIICDRMKMNLSGRGSRI